MKKFTICTTELFGNKKLETIYATHYSESQNFVYFYSKLETPTIDDVKIAVAVTSILFIRTEKLEELK